MVERLHAEIETSVVRFVKGGGRERCVKDSGERIVFTVVPHGTFQHNAQEKLIYIS
jgi:hypothetical protein